MRHECDRKPEERGDLRRMPMLADAVRGHVLEHDPCMRGCTERTPRTGHARLRVDDHVFACDLVRDGRKCEKRGGRIAAWVRDQPPQRRADLRKTVGPGLETLRLGVLEAVPRLVHARLGKAMSPGEIDDDSARWRDDLSRGTVWKTDECHIGPARKRGVVRDETGYPAPAVTAETRVENGRRLARQ